MRRSSIMRWLVIAIVVVGCGGSDKRDAPPPANATATPAPAPKPAEETVEAVALRFINAALAGDHATARSLSITGDEAVTISKKANKADWDEILDGTLKQLAREGAEAKAEGKLVTLDKAEVVQRTTLDPATNEKVLRKVEIAVLKLGASADPRGESSPFPWVFMKTDAGWKFSVKK